MLLSDGTTIKIPNHTFNAFYIFLHFVKHYYAGGIGLRQLVDWTRCLSNYQKEIDKEQLNSYTQKYDLEREWNVFYGFITNCLGFDSVLVQDITKEEENQRQVWLAIKTTGNMGHVLYNYDGLSFLSRNVLRIKNAFIGYNNTKFLTQKIAKNKLQLRLSGLIKQIMN